jgi:hypothetical protein
MHQQIRVVPAASPSDLAKLLAVLAAKKVNLVAAGGGNIELGEEFAFVPSEGQEQAAMDALAKDYQPRLLNAGVDYKLCWLTNDVGQLLECIQSATEENLERGRKVKDILIGVEPDEEGRIGVQVYSVDAPSEEAPVGA